MLERFLNQAVSQGQEGAIMPRCTRAGEMIERPDYAGRAHVKARVAILGTVVLRMRWPEARLIHMSVRVGDDLVDRRLGRGGVPSLGSDRNMPCSIDHKACPNWPVGRHPYSASLAE